MMVTMMTMMMKQKMKSKGVASGIFYPIPLHLQECFASLGYKKGDFPNAEAACAQVVALPIFAEMTGDARGFFERGGSAPAQSHRRPTPLRLCR